MSQQSFDVLLTSKQLEHRLDVTAMTVWNWRREIGGQPQIPTVIVPGLKGPGHAVRFPLLQVIQWLTQYKPTIAYKILEDSCSCRHCVKMRKLQMTVAEAEHTAIEQIA